MTRVFDAPRTLVFDAWTKPELLTRWLGMFGGWRFEVCDVDLRVGGSYRFVWRGPDGSRLGVRGVYREIVPGQRIVNTEKFDQPWYQGEAVGTVVFTERGGQTTMTTTLRYQSRDVRDAVLKSPMETGVAAGYETLAALLATLHKQETEIAMQKITPFLWFNDNAEEAVNFYVSIFKNAKILNVMRYGDGGPAKKGKVMGATFQLEGQTFRALNGGPKYRFTPAISLFVDCQTQEDVDQLWRKLLAGGGHEDMCGWLTDRFGLSWQIIPSVLGKYLQDKNAGRAQRVMQAMLQMRKIDIAKLQQAYDQE